ncbi:MAG: AAA family ATPase, partial [Gemmataceae bacterium]|nr:AAA family ATPase [Gemmataceae bacterium]
AGTLWRHAGPDGLALGECVLDLDPPARSACWRQPIRLALPAVRWRHGEEHLLAHVPALGINVAAPSPEALERMLVHHAELALMRHDLRDLRSLAWLARAAGLRLVAQPFSVHLPSPRQAAQQEEEERLKVESVLDQVANDLTRPLPSPAYEADADAARVGELLAGRPPRSVLLVGPSGVGKTAIVGEAVRQRSRLGLHGRPFYATSGARLVAGQTGFGMWQERCQQVVKEAARRRAVLVLGNLLELADVGKSEYQAQGLGSFLRPWLQRGEVQAVAECTPEQLPLLERLDPPLLRAFSQIRIEEPSAPRLEAILRDAARAWGRSVLTPDGLAELLRLHRRYATYSANPGRPLRFLAGLLFDQPEGEPVTRAAVARAFSRESGLPPLLLDDEERLDPAQVATWFRARVIGQDEATSLVADLLATIKTSLGRPLRPLASLLFIGPTGVGKTELARSLAEYLFGSADRLTRFDMSEYADPLAVQRLIGGPGGEGVLTAKVREQPFAVVLLDEVEKADDALFDLLLQVLGEGRLTDAAGRLADFRNCVVVMTSNLGAETWQSGGIGLVPRASARERAREHFTEAVRREVRPELFNRIDRIVPFSPLDEETVRGVAARQVELLRGRDGIRYRGVSLDVSDGLASWLAQKGYDARYGARPLKRAIERELLAPLAADMNLYAGEAPLRVRLSLQGGKPLIEVRAKEGASSGAGRAEAAVVGRLVELRRSLQALEACDASVALANDIYQRERHPHRPHYDASLADMAKLRDGIAGRLAAVSKLEEDALVTLYTTGADKASLERWEAEGSLEQAAFDELLMALFLRGFPVPDAVSLAVFCEDQATLFGLARAYADAAEAARMTATLFQIVPPLPGAKEPGLRLVQEAKQLWPDDDKPVEVRAWDRAAKGYGPPARAGKREGVIGLGLEIKGRAAMPRFGGEAGLHAVQWPRYAAKALCVADDIEMTQLPFPEGIERRGMIGAQPRRRLYRPEQGSGDDARLGEFTVPGTGLEEMVRHATEACLKLMAQAMLKE